MLANLGLEHDRTPNKNVGHYRFKQLVKEAQSGVEILCWSLHAFLDRAETHLQAMWDTVRQELDAAAEERRGIRVI